MIDPEHPVEVTVQLSDAKLILAESHPSKTSPLYIDDPRHRLIAAKTDERFKIEVVLNKEFDFMDAKYVRVLVEMDGGLRTWSKCISRKLGKNKGCSCQLNTLRAMINGNWRNFGCAFGELQVIEEIELTPEEASKEALNRGVITVTIQRGSAIHSDFNLDDEPKLKPMKSLRTSNRVVKDHCKTHGLKECNGGQDNKPPKEQWAFTPARGKAGDPLTYTFTYVSKDVLLANRVPKARKGVTPATKATNKSTGKAQRAAEGEHSSEKKRKIDYVDMTQVDEDPPAKIAKVDTSEGSSQIPTPCLHNESTHEEKPKRDPINKVKSSMQNKTTQATIQEMLARQPVNPADNKAKKRKAMIEELEALKLQQRIKEMEQAIRKLDEE